MPVYGPILVFLEKGRPTSGGEENKGEWKSDNNPSDNNPTATFTSKRKDEISLQKETEKNGFYPTAPKQKPTARPERQ